MEKKMKSITIDWKLLGAELANLSADEQGEFFNGFIGEMLTWDTHMDREAQCLAIRDKLDKKKRSYIATIGYEERGDE